MKWNEFKNENIKINKCETCKYYEECLKNIYDANIERRYLIEHLQKDCWEELWIKERF